ncbi:hypothetical protein ACH4UM_13705 [Streptomyces sp. NPDC020801]|uniref:hypothetical protein n=1 Tax=unclassified Streptomyces TaxID=2593676 RepID=UPI0037BA7B44
MGWQVAFAPDCGIDTADEDEIRDALLDVAVGTTADEASCMREGTWPEHVRTVTVLRRLAGGRSGSEVLEIEVARGGSTSLQVAKLMPHADAVEEWDAYRELSVSLDATLFVPIVAVGASVKNPRLATPFDRHVVVYAHVSDRDPDPRGLVRSLEDVWLDALRDHQRFDEAVRVVSGLMATLTRKLYREGISRDGDLTDENGRLGCDLSLAVDAIEEPPDGLVLLVDGNPQENDMCSDVLKSGRLLRSSTSPPGQERSLSVGGHTRLRLDEVQVDGATVAGRFKSTKVRVALTGRAFAGGRPSHSIKPGSAVDVYGRVTSVRSQEWSRLLTDAFAGGDGFREGPDSLEYEGVRTDHPMKALHDTLDSTSTTRTRSAVHGDLNPRNVLFCGPNPYLIDFASFRRDAYTLSDPAWMEVCVLRDCVAGLLGWPDLVRLQRYLGLLTVVLPLWGAAAADRAAADLAARHREAAPELGRCLSLLWALRRGIWQWVPSKDRAAFPAHYFQHLLLAACRTFKWKAPVQEFPRVIAAAAAAGVACECLSPGRADLFARWSEEEMRAACEVLLTHGTGADWESGDLVSVAVLAAGRAGNQEQIAGWRRSVAVYLADGPLTETVEVLRRCCQDADCGDAACEGRPEADFVYIPLEGHALAPGEPFVQHGQGALSAASRDCLELLAAQEAVVLLGESGSGATVVARQLRRRLLAARGPGADRPPEDGVACSRLPLLVSAPQLSRVLASRSSAAAVLREACRLQALLSEERLGRLMALGVVHLTVDALHKVDYPRRAEILEWLKELRTEAPHVRVVVCQRGHSYDPQALGWPAVALHKVREWPARRFLAEVLRTLAPQDWQPKLDQLQERLFDDPDTVALRDLAGKPQFLWMLVKHLAQTGDIPANPGVLARKYLLRQLKSSNHSSEVERKLRLLRELVTCLGDSGALSRGEALRVISAHDNGNAELTLTALLSTSVINEDSSRITFCNPLVQAYCAASVLQQYGVDEVDEVTTRILKHPWRDAAQMLVADPRTDPGLVAAVVEKGAAAHPLYGAMLLQAAPEDAVGATREDFLGRQQAVLRSPDSGLPAWRRSAYALARYGSQPALEVLRTAALQRDGAPEAVAAALDGLVMMHQWFVPGASARLREVLTRLLDPPTDLRADDRVVARALRCVQVAGLGALVAHVLSRVAPGTAWSVVSQAWETLRQLDVQPTRALRRTYGDACAARLSEVDEQLRSTARTETAADLNDERMALLELLAAEGRIETLLSYRFRMGLAEDPRWRQLLRTAARAQQSQSPANVLADAVLDDQEPGVRPGPERWRTLLTRENEQLAVIAGHHILAEGLRLDVPDLRDILTRPTPAKLSLAAAAVSCLPPDQDPAALGQLLDPFLDHLTADYVDAVASFVTAVVALDQGTGLRLALRVQDTMAKQGLVQEALNWPWAMTWRRVLPPRAEMRFFMREQEFDSHARICLLGSADVLLDAPYVQPAALTPQEQRELMRLRPQSPHGVVAHQFVLLAASAGLHQALPFAREVAESEHNIGTVITHSHGQYGRIEVTLAAHAVTAIGYLGRLALMEDSLALDAEEAESTLRGMARDTSSMHPSMERARLIGLGYWGHWDELLSALEGADPILLAAARNLIGQWLPGPRQRRSDTYFAVIARSITRRLQSGNYNAAAQATLTDIRDGIEDRLGRYVL